MRAHTHSRYSDTDRPKGATIGGNGGRGNVSVWTVVQLTATNPSGWGQPGQLSVVPLSPHRVSSQKPPAQKRTIACRQVAQSPFPVPCLSPDPEFAPNLRSLWKGVLGTGGISSSVTTPLPRLSLVSWLKLFLEAAPGALGLTSSILRHSKRVFWREWKKEFIKH